jgi:hypothetical protein
LAFVDAGLLSESSISPPRLAKFRTHGSQPSARRAVGVVATIQPQSTSCSDGDAGRNRAPFRAGVKIAERYGVARWDRSLGRYVIRLARGGTKIAGALSHLPDVPRSGFADHSRDPFRGCRSAAEAQHSEAR